MSDADAVLSQFSHLVRTLLTKRGFTEKETIEAFLNPDYDAHMHDPLLLAGMDRAVERVLKALEKKERIAIYADFDSDGIPAGVVLKDFFARIGYDNVDVYIPHRHNEGYGFHAEAIDKLHARGATLIITVDVGITAIDAVEHAKQKGIDVIVTDHHELSTELPKAHAVVNPKREGYPFPDLCGAAVAYKLVQALIAEGRARGDARFTNIPDGWEKWLLDLVVIGTIGDMVPLVDENRVLAHYGLRVLRKSSRPGLLALFRKLRVSQKDLTEDDIGFLIAPRINAASRMDVPELAFRLLATQDSRETEAIATELEGLNRKRKGAVAATVREVKKRLRERSIESPVIVLGDPEWRPALLGLAANSIVDGRGGVVCLWGRDGAGRLKGSCRSDGGTSVVELFQSAGGVLEQFGGHHASGGFSVTHEHVHTLPQVFADCAERLECRALERETEDAVLSLESISHELMGDIVRLAPFGIGNPKPVLRVAGVIIRSVRQFGKAQEHVEIMCESEMGQTLKTIRFFSQPEQFSVTPQAGAHVDILGTLEKSSFGGRTELRLRIGDIVSSS